MPTHAQALFKKFLRPFYGFVDNFFAAFAVASKTTFYGFVYNFYSFLDNFVYNFNGFLDNFVYNLYGFLDDFFWLC
jgi:hypothetical protein